MKTILVLTDFSKRAAHAAEYALGIAAKAKAEVLLYNAFYAPQVVSLESGVYPYYEDVTAIEEEGRKEMDSLIKHLNKKFMDTHHLQPPPIRVQNEPGKLGENVHILTTQKSIWMIVMGDKSKENAVSRFVFGSNSHAVIDNATCPVLLIPEKADLKELRSIVLATELDQSEHHAMLFLGKFADLWRAPITVLHVCDKTLSLEEKTTNYTHYKKILAGIQYPDVNYVDVRGDEITSTISTYAGREKIDMIAIVHKKRSFIGDVLHKSISKKMLNYHRIPLLVLHKS